MAAGLQYTKRMSQVELQFATDEEHQRHDAGADDPGDDPGFVLAHISDLHLSSLKDVHPGNLLDKRLLGYLSWRLRRQHEHRSEVLDALCADLRGNRPDHIAVTGDLTHVGLPQEFREAAAWLARLGPARDITLVPGNHDAYVRQPWAQTFAQWLEYMAGDDAVTGSGAAAGNVARDAVFPSLRIRRNVALIGLSTATPTMPLLATGSLGRRQIGQLDQMLEETAGSGLFRIVLLHHPPAAQTVGWRKSLTDGAAFRAVLARRGAELVLHGHAHFSAATYLNVPQGRVPVFGVPSASAVSNKSDHLAKYHVYRIRGGSDGWQLKVSVRAYAPDRARFVPSAPDHLDAALTATAA